MMLQIPVAKNRDELRMGEFVFLLFYNPVNPFHSMMIK